MISEPLQRLLVEQVGAELNAHQAYMGISLYFERRTLKRWAHLFHEQAVEEAGHARKIIDFLMDNEVDFDVPATRGATTHYESAAHAVQAALDSELRVTAQFDAMAAAAQSAADHRGFQFLQWFIDEQVEEERTMRGLLDLIASGMNLFQAEPLLGVLAGE